MAKDGTARGGARSGSGRKAKPVALKIIEGKTTETSGRTAANLGFEIPETKDFLKRPQNGNRAFRAKEIHDEVWRWIGLHGCMDAVSPQLVDQYSMTAARWLQCEEAISECGLLAAHPTTGNAIASPYVTMSREYMRQMLQIWYQINQVIKESCSVNDLGIPSPQDSMMEKLLSKEG